MPISKSKIDKAGRALAKYDYKDEVEYIELEELFDEHRMSHLQPLSETTIELQRLMAGYGREYYIAQRLKRKPQIIRKLNRLSVRLSQLQDIGGCRIIVEKNSDVISLLKYLEGHTTEKSVYSIKNMTDYRERGRDDTGYRALHVLLERNGYALELQIRSQIQHYWAESIERTSVVYGHHLKEQEGDRRVINYFKMLSDAFYEVEAGRNPSREKRLEIDALTEECRGIIERSDKHKAFDSFVNEGLIRALMEKERGNRAPLKNWLLVFDWRSGSFFSWDSVSKDPKEA
ncbi:MAG: RelA/SpoT domain-containing protein, partial [Alphaproteobacteria bacterium]|nr:RelA/SpoT domain-containing protein [Alphaproteobacteria bacterium]